MLKTCAKCGRIHDINYICKSKRIYTKTDERKERSTNAWKNKSLEIRKKANYLCEVCKQEGIYTYKGLEVHHITKLKDDNTKLLDNYNLICLCIEHHKQADNNEIDKDYLLKLAKEREDHERL